MVKMLIHIIDSSIEEYIKYRNTLEKLSLRRLLESIIDQEFDKKRDLKEYGESIFGNINDEILEAEIHSFLRPLKLKGGVKGLQEIATRKEDMADLFASLAEHNFETEGNLFFTQCSLNERRYACLVRARIELESLI